MRKVIVNSTPLISLVNGHIDAVMPVIKELERHGIYISNDLKERVKRVSKE